MREAPSRRLIEALWSAGAIVQAFDPQAMEEARHSYPAQIAGGRLVLCETEEAALHEADALVIVTEWRAFRSPDFMAIKAALKQPVIFDGRNIYDPERLRKEGFIHYGIGLGTETGVTSDPARVEIG
jgi:UDPglucose 6-dehydrogenase